ncbi:CocE/NonD family hydrolase [Nonomuraea turcica]|uniref:CocE/NonD family hydrolase n=1 Tax=Nonomuraea sp. G32 TaxID=3067274 RepID=UPI00273BFC24|nr:CocE/NonD family hydrolase [Nonomuraea sp. G32]MDP4502549.1 CocE/NonD family hydrolase [Nonomuraea sp. G32]
MNWTGTIRPVPEEVRTDMVPMRDGIRLATDVYLPRSPESALPAILIRLPYGKTSEYCFADQIAARLTARGYACVVQDVRGKFDSEGETFGLLSEAADGFDTLDWIVAQPWSDGRVGMFGDSYFGFTQWAAASTSHPALRAIVPRVTTHAFDRFPQQPESTVIDPPWLTFGVYLQQCWVDRGLNEQTVDYRVRPLTAAFEAVFRDLGARSPWFDQFIHGPLRAPVFPSGHPLRARPIPVLHTVGWYDNLAIASMRSYAEFLADPNWGPLQYLFADSIDHENYHLDYVPVRPEHDHATMDPKAMELLLDRYVEPAIDFFDAFVRESADAERFPRVQWHQGHVGYRTAGTWPPENARKVMLYLDGLDRAAEGEGGVLTLTAPAGDQQATWRYDPSNLVPSSTLSSWSQLRDCSDEAAAGERPDVLRFDLPAVEEEIDLAGPVDLWVAVDSTAERADVFAKLLDVAPDGRATLIVRGQGTLTNPSPDAEVRIEMGHVGLRIRRGHKVRLHIASSDYPEYVPSTGDARNPWTAADRRASTQVLHSCLATPARLSLTVMDGAPENRLQVGE